MTAPGRTQVRFILATGQAILALALLLHLHGGWMVEHRARERAYQDQIDAIAQAGKWHDDGWGFEACYFGAPNEISAMAMIDLPVVLPLGQLVTPNNVLDKLLQQRPGWPLPSTRMAFLVLLFAVGVWFFWWALGCVLTSLNSALWWTALVGAPLACVLVAFMSRWVYAGDYLRLGALMYWCVLLPGMVGVWTVRRRRAAKKKE